MGDAVMNWDEIQSRWRRRYKGKMYRIKASDLGGTTATDTKLAANRWFQDRKTERDKELALETPRPNELAYRAELENIQSAIQSFLLVMRTTPDTQSMLAPNVELLKRRETLLKQALQQDTLPLLDDFLRNPVYISPQSVEEAAVRDAKRVLRKRGRSALSPEEVQSIRAVDGKDHIVRKVVRKNANGSYGSPEEMMFDAEAVIEERLTKTIELKDKMLARNKREAGLIPSESDRGQMIRILREQGIEVAESRKLDYHIDKFLDAKKQECQLGGISAGRLKKIGCTVDIYKKWSPIINGNVDRIGTKEHIESYYNFLVQRVLAGEIKPKYAHNLFGDFKGLVFWLVNEEVLKETPRCLQLKSNKYTFPVVRQKPKTADLDLVRKALNAASPRLKLCILLTLNCGFGGAEIGRLTKDEYDPVSGRIVHKRCKTQKSDNVPTVCYKLWGETKELLDQEIANRKNYPQHPSSADYLLVNSNGMPLWSESVDTGKSDNITTSFKRLVAKLRKDAPDFPQITYYQFRRTSSTLIYNEPKYRIYNGLWLGHAPQTVAERHYSVAEETMLDECLGWLHGQIFGTEVPSEEGEDVNMERV